MMLRYLLLDRNQQLVKVRRAQVHALWKGEIAAADLGDVTGSELRLVSVLCDRRLRPKKLFLLRLPLTQGRFTKANYLTLRVFSMPDCVTPREVIQHHTAGWPRDFFKQLAVVMDVPCADLNVPMGIGGPLFMAAALRVTPRQALRYLK